MICCLCLRENEPVLELFSKQGLELDIAAVLTKHFWFEPRTDDHISTAICDSCWNTVSVFHEFYLNVEKVHRSLTEGLSFKSTNEGKSTVFLSPILPSSVIKYELENDNDDTHNTPASTVQPKYIGIECLAARDNVCGDDSCSMASETLMDLVPAIPLAEKTEDMLASACLIEEPAIKLNNSKDTDIVTPPKSDIGRSTRSSTIVHVSKSSNPVNPNLFSSESNQICLKEKLEITLGNSKVTKNRRGRPPKIQTNENANTNFGNKPARNVKIFKKRMQLADETIAKCVCLTCDICKKEEATFLELRRHMDMNHQVKGYVVCCDKKFFKRALLLEHADKHLNPDSYKCKDCDKAFADKQSMRRHILIKHQPEESKTYQCEHCPKKFARPFILEQHRLTHEERKHICDICQLGFPSSTKLKTHIRTKHSNYGAKMCDICAEVIHGRTAFARHQLEHAGVFLPKVQCDKCGSWHKDKYNLQKHKRRHIDEGKEFVCNICGKNSPTLRALKSHQNFVHFSDRTFECNVCKKSFKRALRLKEHMTMHTGEVLYRCPHCPKTFNSSANLYSHRKKIHRIEFEEARKQRLSSVSAKPLIKH